MARLRGPNGGFLRGPGGGGSRKLASSVLHSVTLQDTSGAGSSPFARFGLAFEKGDVPAGQIPQALVGGMAVRSSILNKNTWSDGSLRYCVLCVDAGSFSASQSKTVDVRSVSGSQSTSGLNVSTALNAIDDLTVEVTNHSGSSSGSLSNRTYSLQTAIATASRLELTDDTPLCVRLKVWEKVTGEEHLICINYVDIWLDDQGGVEAVEWTPVMSQHWFVNDPFGVVQTKEERTYNAAIKSGTTTLESHTALAHAYYCQWAGLRTADDDQHAKRIWIDEGTAMPTLIHAYSNASKAKMARAGFLPPLRQDATYTNPNTIDTVVPLGETSGTVVHNHRRAINGTGAYQGRGALTNMDSICLTQPTAANWRISRVSAQAGLSAFYHIRDHRNASGGFADGDVSAGIIPPPVEQIGAQTYTGLAGETVAIKGSGSTINDDAPVGGDGAFSSWDNSHHVDYAYFVAFAEGEAYLADAVLSAFDYVIAREANYNEFGRRPGLQFANVGSANGFATRAAQFSLPTTRYGLTWRQGQERSTAWMCNSVLHASNLVADADRHRPVLDKQIEHHSLWVEATLGVNDANFPASHLAKGGWMHTQGGTSTVGTPEMNNVNPTPYYMLSVYAEDKGLNGFKRFAAQCAKFTAAMWEYPYSVGTYRDLRSLDYDALNYVPHDEPCRIVNDVAISGSTLTINMVSGLSIAEDDIVYFSRDDDAGNPLTLPSGVAFETKYHMVNVSGSTCQLATTQGGAAITIGDGTVTIGVFAADYSTTPAGAGGRGVPNDDGSTAIAYAAAEITYGFDEAVFSSSLIASTRTWFAPTSIVDYAAWNLDGDLLK